MSQGRQIQPQSTDSFPGIRACKGDKNWQILDKHKEKSIKK